MHMHISQRISIKHVKLFILPSSCPLLLCLLWSVSVYSIFSQLVKESCIFSNDINSLQHTLTSGHELETAREEGEGEREGEKREAEEEDRGSGGRSGKERSPPGDSGSDGVHVHFMPVSTGGWLSQIMQSMSGLAINSRQNKRFLA